MLVQGTRLVDEKAILYPQENFQFSYETWDMSRMLCQKATCVHGTSNGGVIHRKVEPRLSIWIVLPHVILTAIQWDRQRQYYPIFQLNRLNFRGLHDLLRLHTYWVSQEKNSTCPYAMLFSSHAVCRAGEK
jgi:hypothetical protein